MEPWQAYTLMAIAGLLAFAILGLPAWFGIEFATWDETEDR